MKIFTEKEDKTIAERRLMRALLDSAIEDLKEEGESYKSALKFFLSKNEQYAFSFRNICRELTLDPKQIFLVLGFLLEKEKVVEVENISIEGSHKREIIRLEKLLREDVLEAVKLLGSLHESN